MTVKCLSTVMLVICAVHASHNAHHTGIAKFTDSQSDQNSLHCDPLYGDVVNPSPQPDPVAPATFMVAFHTNVMIDGQVADPIVMNVTRKWAPLGADRFYSLIKDGFYNCSAYFRVVPNFVVQYGIAASPDETAKWNTAIPDDNVTVSNSPWTVAYATAGPDTRTTQLFINYIDNSRLDAYGFAPFAIVTSGFETALAITNPTPGDSDGVDQDLYTELGNSWILSQYPNISIITGAALVYEEKNVSSMGSEVFEGSDGGTKIDVVTICSSVAIVLGIVLLVFKYFTVEKKEPHCPSVNNATDVHPLMLAADGGTSCVVRSDDAPQGDQRSGAAFADDSSI